MKPRSLQLIGLIFALSTWSVVSGCEDGCDTAQDCARGEICLSNGDCAPNEQSTVPVPDTGFFDFGVVDASDGGEDADTGQSDDAGDAGTDAGEDAGTDAGDAGEEPDATFRLRVLLEEYGNTASVLAEFFNITDVVEPTVTTFVDGAAGSCELSVWDPPMAMRPSPLAAERVVIAAGGMSVDLIDPDPQNTVADGFFVPSAAVPLLSLTSNTAEFSIVASGGTGLENAGPISALFASVITPLLPSPGVPIDERGGINVQWNPLIDDRIHLEFRTTDFDYPRVRMWCGVGEGDEKILASLMGFYFVSAEAGAAFNTARGNRPAEMLMYRNDVVTQNLMIQGRMTPAVGTFEIRNGTAFTLLQ